VGIVGDVMVTLVSLEIEGRKIRTAIKDKKGRLWSCGKKWRFKEMRIDNLASSAPTQPFELQVQPA
jgi:hypothetical protein